MDFLHKMLKPFFTEATGISIPTSFALKPGVTIPLQVPTKTTRSSSDNYNEPNTSEKFTSQDNSSGVTSHQFHYQTFANLPFFQFDRTQRNLPIYTPFTTYIIQTQNNQTIAIHSNRSNDQKFMLNVVTKTVLMLSRPQLAPLNFADTYSLGSTKLEAISNRYIKKRHCKSVSKVISTAHCT